MNRSKVRSTIHVFDVVIAVFILISCSALGAQTTSTVPPETAPAAAPAEPAKKPAKPLTPAQVAAQQRAEAAREAREERAAERAQTVAAKTAATPAAKTATAKSATATKATTPLATPATATTATSAAGTSALSRTAPTAATGSTAPVGTGTLAWGPRVYTSTGCVHNGSSAVCTFTFVNQGNAATLAAGGAGELSGIQFVDDAHVPHRWDSAYFMDKYGAQQKRLLIQPGDSGTYIVVFPNVDAQVASAEFHLRQQVVGGITVGAAPSNPATSKPATPAASTTK